MNRRQFTAGLGVTAAALGLGVSGGQSEIGTPEAFWSFVKPGDIVTIAGFNRPDGTPAQFVVVRDHQSGGWGKFVPVDGLRPGVAERYARMATHKPERG